MHATLRDVVQSYWRLWRARAHHRPEERELELDWARTFDTFRRATGDDAEQHAQARRYARSLPFVS